jgi:hypothetical protein
MERSLRKGNQRTVERKKRSSSRTGAPGRSGTSATTRLPWPSREPAWARHREEEGEAGGALGKNRAEGGPAGTREASMRESLRRWEQGPGRDPSWAYGGWCQEHRAGRDQGVQGVAAEKIPPARGWERRLKEKNENRERRDREEGDIFYFFVFRNSQIFLTPYFSEK